MGIESYYSYLTAMQLAKIATYGGRMLEKQDETIKEIGTVKEEIKATREEVKATREELSSKLDRTNELLERRFERLEEEIERIKKALIKAG